MKKRLTALLLLVVTAFLIGCTPNLTEREKSDLLVQAERIKYAMPTTEGKRFFNLYEDLLETGSRETRKELEKLVSDYTLSSAEEMSGLMRKEQGENFILIAESAVEELDFFELESMEAFADCMEIIDDTLIIRH